MSHCVVTKYFWHFVTRMVLCTTWITNDFHEVILLFDSIQILRTKVLFTADGKTFALAFCVSTV